MRTFPTIGCRRARGRTGGIITVRPGDSVTWFNADTAFHTVTSVVPTGDRYPGPDDEDGAFDSGLFTAGKSYTLQFDVPGDYYYYCTLHPWMTGTVHVVSDPGNTKSIVGVASDHTDDGMGFVVSYVSDADLSGDVAVDPDEKTLTFEVVGEGGGHLALTLPKGLIDNPVAVWVDGEAADFDSAADSAATRVDIQIDPSSREIRIMGSDIVPEFGVALLILAISVASVVVFSKKAGLYGP